MKSQKEQLLTLLKRGAKVTSLDALKKFGCFCLAERARDLRNEGVNVKTTMIQTKTGKRVASYSL